MKQTAYRQFFNSGAKIVDPLRIMMSLMAVCQLNSDMCCKQVDILAQLWPKGGNHMSKA